MISAEHKSYKAVMDKVSGEIESFVLVLLVATSLLLPLPVFAHGPQDGASVSLAKSNSLIQSSLELPAPSLISQVVHKINIGPKLDEAAPPMQTDSKKKAFSFVAGARTFASTFEAKEANRLANQGVKITGNPGGNFFHLEKGNLLFSPDNDIVVGTRDGDVYIGAGASVLVMDSGHEVAIAVYDLYQDSPDKVSVYCGEKELVLDRGRVLLLTRQITDNFDELQGTCSNIDYGKAIPVSIDDSVKGFMANFSILSAVKSVGPLKSMLDSDDKRDQLAIANILKGSVVVGDLNNNGGPQ